VWKTKKYEKMLYFCLFLTCELSVEKKILNFCFSDKKNFPQKQTVNQQETKVEKWKT